MDSDLRARLSLSFSSSETCFSFLSRKSCWSLSLCWSSLISLSLWDNLILSSLTSPGSLEPLCVGAGNAFFSTFFVLSAILSSRFDGIAPPHCLTMMTYSATSNYSCLICPLRLSISCELGSLFTTGLFLIFLALDAYFTVLKDSSRLLSAGETQAIMVVLELPPKESYKILVSFESLYGICSLAFFSSVSALITYPRHNSPLLILIPSFNSIPVAPVFLILSDPAKSTKWNLEDISSVVCATSSPFFSTWISPSTSLTIFYSMVTVNMACDLEEPSFMRVELV